MCERARAQGLTVPTLADQVEIVPVAAEREAAACLGRPVSLQALDCERWEGNGARGAPRLRGPERKPLGRLDDRLFDPHAGGVEVNRTPFDREDLGTSGTRRAREQDWDLPECADGAVCEHADLCDRGD